MEKSEIDYDIEFPELPTFNISKASGNSVYAKKHLEECNIFLNRTLKENHVLLPLAIAVATNIDSNVPDNILRHAITKGGHAREVAIFYLSLNSNLAFEENLAALIQSELQRNEEEKNRGMICSAISALWKNGQPETRESIIKLKENSLVKNDTIILQCIDLLDQYES